MQEVRLVDIIYIIAGSALIIFRSWLAERAIDFQNTVWGFNFGEREIKATKFGAIIGGLAFITFSLLSLFEVIQPKQ